MLKLTPKKRCELKPKGDTISHSSNELKSKCLIKFFWGGLWGNGQIYTFLPGMQIITIPLEGTLAIT
jgi:hypothetical protein